MTINNEESIEGLVLKNKPYKESDMLVWIYTKTYGKMALIARGVKKMKSKNAPACQTECGPRGRRGRCAPRPPHCKSPSAPAPPRRRFH